MQDRDWRRVAQGDYCVFDPTVEGFLDEYLGTVVDLAPCVMRDAGC